MEITKATATTAAMMPLMLRSSRMQNQEFRSRMNSGQIDGEA